MKTVADSHVLVSVGEPEACCPDFLTSKVGEEDATVAASIFKALADPGRVRLMSMIASAGQEGACVCELVPPLELTQPTVSHHLRILYEAGLLRRERRGSWVYYTIREDSLSLIARTLSA